jgi:hypothetical protein
MAQTFKSSWSRVCLALISAIGLAAVGNVAHLQAQSHQFPSTYERELWRQLEVWPGLLHNTPSHVYEGDGTDRRSRFYVDANEVANPNAYQDEFNALNPGECTFSNRGDIETSFFLTGSEEPLDRQCKEGNGPSAFAVPPPPGALLNPVAVATDSVDVGGNIQHRVYVVDSFNHRVQVFDFNGNVIALPNQMGTGRAGRGPITYPSSTHYPGGARGEMLSWPYGVAVDAQHRILVADGVNNRIAVFNPDGSFEFDVDLPEQPDGISSDSGSGRTKPNQIVLSPGTTVYRPTDALPGSAIGQRIVVADTEHCYVYAFDARFTPIASIPNAIPEPSQHDACRDPESPDAGVTGPGEFSTVTGAAIDGAGRIYVTDFAQNTVQVFNGNLQHLGWIGKPDIEPDPNAVLEGPVSVSFDHQGRMAVTDGAAARVKFYNVSFDEHDSPSVEFQFQLKTTVSVLDFPMGFAEEWGTTPGLDEKGRFLATDPINRRILRFELPELGIVNPAANEGTGTFDVAVPRQKLGPVNGVTTTVVPVETAVTITEGPTPSTATNIAPGEYVRYTFKYVTDLARVTFKINATGSTDEGPVHADEVDAVARKSCAPTCDADHTVRNLEGGALATAIPAGDDSWYAQEVFVRIARASGSAEFTSVYWRLEGAAADASEIVEGESALVNGVLDVPVTVAGASTLFYTPIMPDGAAGAETPVELLLDLIGPHVNLFNWSEPSGHDAQGREWHNDDVTVDYEADDADGSGAIEETGTVTITDEGRGLGMIFTAPDYVGHFEEVDTRTAGGGKPINIDRSAPVITPPANLTVALPVGATSGTASPTELLATAVDPPLGDSSAGSGLNPALTVLHPGNHIFVKGVNEFTFTATDYAGNAADELVVTVIGKTTPTIAYTGATSAVYGAATLAVSAKVTPTGVTGTVTFVLRPSGGGATLKSVTATVSASGVASAALSLTGVNRAPYEIVPTYNGNNNYVPASTTAVVDVLRATPVVTVTGGPVVYNAAGRSASCAVAGVNSETFTTGVLSYTDALGAPVSGQPVNAGDYTASCTFTHNNYNTTTKTAPFRINPRPTTITPIANSKYLGVTPDPVLQYTVSPALLAGGAFTGALSRTPGESLGTYPINLGTLSAGSNYSLGLSATPVLFSILPVPVNVNPVATTDTATTSGAAPVTINVLGNDSDSDGGTITLVSFTQPSSGGVVTSSGALLVFTPASGFTGLATFTYLISDGQGGSATGTVNITVNGAICVGSTTALVRKQVMINSGSRTEGSIQVMTAADVTFNGGTLVGDLFMLGTPTVQVNGTPAAHGGTVNGTGAATPNTHRVTINSGASLGRVVRRTDAIALPAVAAPPSPTGTQSVTINTAGQNPGNFAAIKNLTLNSNVGAYAIPPGTYGSFIANSGSKFVLGVAGGTTPAVYNFEQLTLNSNSALTVVGPIVVTLKKQAAFSGNVGASAHPEWLTLRISSAGLTLDSSISFYGYAEVPNGAVIINSGTQLVGGLAADTLTLNSNGKLLLRQVCVNQAPTVSASDRSDYRGNTANVQITGIDPEGGALTYSATGLPPGTSISSTGLIAGTLTTSGVYSVTVTVKDPANATGTATFVWTVLTPNQPPVATNDTATTVGAAPVELVVLANDSDADGGTLSVTSYTQPDTGGIVTQSGNQLLFTPTPGFSGTVSFTYRVSDGQGGTANGTVTVTVTAPICGTFTLTGNTATSGSAANIRTFSINGVSVKASAFSRTKTGGAWNTAYLGAYSHGLGVTDGSEGTGGDDQHTLDNIGDRLNYVLFEFSQPVTVSKAYLDYVGADSDITVWIGTKANPYTTHLALSDALLNSLGTPQQSAAANGSTRWASVNAAGVSGNVFVIAADVTSTSPNDSFKLGKLELSCGANAPPTVTVSNQTHQEGAAVSLQIVGADPNASDDLTYSATGLPPGLSINASTGLITGTLSYTGSGTYDVTVTVKDEANATGTDSFVWTVTNKNRAPDAVNDTLSTSKNTPKTMSLVANDADPDGDTLTIASVTQPSAGSVVKYSNGTVKYTPPSNWTGTTTFSYTVSDGNGGTDTATVSVTVSRHGDTDDCVTDHDHDGDHDRDDDRERDCDRDHRHSSECDHDDDHERDCDHNHSASSNCNDNNGWYNWRYGW